MSILSIFIILLLSNENFHFLPVKVNWTLWQKDNTEFHHLLKTNISHIKLKIAVKFSIYAYFLKQLLHISSISYPHKHFFSSWTLNSAKF